MTGLTVGDDGDLWFAEADRGKLGRMAQDGTLVDEYSLGLSGDETLKDVTNGPDGWIWFTVEHDGGQAKTRTSSLHTVGRFNPADGDMCFFREGLTGAPNKIVAASDGKLYFTESSDPAAIGRVKPDGTDLIGRHEVTNGQLEATVTANTQDTTYHVEYGPDSSFGEQSGDVTVPASAGAEPVTELVELALEPDSHYHARLVATNASGEAVSPELELWTDENGELLDFEPVVPEVEVPKPTPTPPGKPADPGSQADEHRPADLPAAVPVAPPVLGKAVVVRPLSGSVRVKAPGARSYSALATGANLPVGTLVDTRGGKIVLQSARNSLGRTQNGTFWGGVFQIRQGRKSKGMTDLHLRGGGFGRCGPAPASPCSPTRRAGSAASSAACGARTSTRASAPTAATASPPCAARSGSPATAATGR